MPKSPETGPQGPEGQEPEPEKESKESRESRREAAERIEKLNGVIEKIGERGNLSSGEVTEYMDLCDQGYAEWGSTLVDLENAQGMLTKSLTGKEPSSLMRPEKMEDYHRYQRLDEKIGRDESLRILTHMARAKRTEIGLTMYLKRAGDKEAEKMCEEMGGI